MADVYEHCVFPQSGPLARVILVNNSTMTWINQKEPISYVVPHSCTCLQVWLP
jgi:hypothetical protein